MEFLAKRLGKWGARLLVLVVLALIAIGIFFAVKNYFVGDLETEVKVSKAQTGAAIDSGHAAVEALGERSKAEARGAQTVEEAQDEIDAATDPSGVTDAGRDGLHSVRGRRQPGSSR